MSKHKEYSKTFGIFYDNYRRWYREMAARGELSDHPEEQFYDFFLKNFMPRPTVINVTSKCLQTQLKI